MDRKDSAFEQGMALRNDMWGGGTNQRQTQPSEFTQPFEDLVTRYCFGDVWCRPELDRRTRSLITLAALTALTKPNQLKAHVRGALANGVSVEEIREVIMHTAIYAGIPSGVEALNAAAEVLGDKAR